MIYWNTTPGAAYDVAIPNSYGLTPEAVAGKTIRFEVRNDVGRQTFPSGGFPPDAVTPGWIVLHQTNGATPGGFPPDGEYTYEAFLTWDGGEVVLSTGLMVLGDYAAPHPGEYEKTIEYEQYD